MCRYVFICTFDLFKEGRCVYTFENIFKESIEDVISSNLEKYSDSDKLSKSDILTLGDESIKIVINTRGTKGATKQMKQFLRFVEDSTSKVASEFNDPLINKLDKTINDIKSNGKTGDVFMKYRDNMLQAEEKGYLAGIKEGVEKGKAEGKAESILTILKAKNYNIEDVEKKINDVKDVQILSELMLKAVLCVNEEEFIQEMKKLV